MVLRLFVVCIIVTAFYVFLLDCNGFFLNFRLFFGWETCILRLTLSGLPEILTHKEKRKEMKLTMKKILIPLVILFLLAVAVTPALAAAGDGTQKSMGKNNAFSLQGTITAIDPANHTITVHVVRGNELVEPYIGQDLVITTTASTRYLSKRGPSTVPITFDDLKIGNWVSSNGRFKEGVWTAARITVAPGRNK
jgi:hypothetical protein